MFDFVIAEILLCVFAFEKVYWNKIYRICGLNARVDEKNRKNGNQIIEDI
jgi:hypothetical protein